MSRTWIKDGIETKWSRTWQIPSAIRMQHEDNTVTATITWEDACPMGATPYRAAYMRPDGLLLTVGSTYEPHRDGEVFEPVNWKDMEDFETALKALKKLGEKMGRELRDSLDGHNSAERAIDRVTSGDDPSRSAWAIRQAYKNGWDGVGNSGHP